MALEDDGDISLDPVVSRAHKRFRRTRDFEQQARENWLSDYKFANGDEYNHWQWPAEIYTDRAARPSLTVNETRIHNLHVINEALQRKTDVKYRAAGGGATEEAAEVLEGMYRHIAAQSGAQNAQKMAIEFQVISGLGFTIVEADYPEAFPNPGPQAFDQEIFIRPVENPLSVYLDPDAREPDGSDARFGFVFSDRPKDEIEEKYPKLRGRVPQSNAIDGREAGWLKENTIREARYYEITEDEDELIGGADGTVVYKSDVPALLLKAWEAEAEEKQEPLRRRKVVRKAVKCHLVVGDELIETTDIPGTTIPIVPWLGEVSVVDGVLDRRGHTRAMIGPQRMENYNWSASVEFGALQTKIPFVGPVASIEGLEGYWDTANTDNHSILPYRHIDDNGNPIPPPQRTPPPTSGGAYIDAVQMARQFMMTASGQYEADLGAQGNERSGRAIMERQRQGDRATYHYTDNQAMAIRRQGRIVKEWIPKIYDVERVAKIVLPDGNEETILVSPDSPEALHSKRIASGIQRVFNPAIGSYDTVSDTGPDYATQRQETFEAIIQIVTQAPQLLPQVGDLLFKAADFPMAEEIADRLKPGLPPEVQAAMAAAQAETAKLQKLLGETMQALTEERIKSRNDNQKAVVDAFDADTRRLNTIKDMLPLDPAGLQTLIHETVRQALQDNLGAVQGHLAQQVTETPEDIASGGDQAAALPVEMPDIGRRTILAGGE